MPALGSTVSFVILGGVVVALAYAMLDPARLLPLTRAEIWIAAIAIFYFLVGLIRGVLAPHPDLGFASALSSFGFVAVLPVLPVLRHFHRAYWEVWVARSIAVGCILSGAVAAAEVGMLGRVRAEAMTGNPLMMGYLAGAWTLASVYLALSSRGFDRWLLSLGAIMGLLTLFLSAGRGPTVGVALILSVVLALWLVRNATNWWRLSFRLYLLLCLAVVAYVVLDWTVGVASFFGRFAILVDFANDPAAANADSNLATRWVMLSAGLQAFQQAPLFGHGRQNVMQLVGSIGNIDLPFTHLHNAYLTEAVANGIVGLSAFLAVLATPLIAASSAPRRWWVVAVIWVSFTGVAALTNIGFNHDLKVFSYCLFILWLNSLSATNALAERNFSVDRHSPG